ncbi:MAG TPA: hypothetical protein VF841_20115 [Anaeromyxobacter sp.]
MATRTGDRVVHSYDVARRQVRCGWPGQTSSTKHAAGVTCTTCRELLDRAPRPHPRAAAPAGHAEP